MSNQAEDRQSTLEPPPIGLADASVFIGVTTMPMHRQREFLAGMRRFFENYRRGTARHLRDGKGGAGRRKFLRYFYRPTLYTLLGSFDMAVLALMEDYEFGVQSFNPFDPMWLSNADRFGKLSPQKRKRLRNLEPTDFAHRIILGPRQTWQGASEMPRRASMLFQGWSRRAAGGTEFVPRHPLLGICQVEVNTGLLVGGGATFLDALVKAIRSEFREFRKKKRYENTELMILGGYSWHELTLLVFSDSYEYIGDFIRGIRGLRLMDVGAALCRKRVRRNPEEPDSYEKAWDALLNQGNLYGLLRMPDRNPPPPSSLHKWLTDPSLLKRFSRSNALPSDTLVGLIERPAGRQWKASARRCSSVLPFGTHVLFNTTTTMGFWAGFLDSALTKGNAEQGMNAVMYGRHHPLCLDDKKRQFYFVRRWNTKAGHEYPVLRKLTKDQDIAVAPGRADFYWPCKPRVRLGFLRQTSHEVVESMIDGYLKLGPQTLCQKVQPCSGEAAEPCGGAVTVSSTLAFRPGDMGEGQIPDSHLSAHTLRKSMVCGGAITTCSMQ